MACVALSPDGNTLASGSQNTIIRVWSLDKEGKAGQALPLTAVAQCEDEVLVEVLRSSDLQLLGLMVLCEATRMRWGASMLVVNAQGLLSGAAT
ncbi:hypothetical protein HaLaN_24697 [Haematococcus lacustris]|uniref:Uncharacterized protein n=1 Tax=Haematococcus lacustris TaxID=44745 RepID=A0A699ZVN5_HAELA|nr:hypothetical protein HaLaN_24697 [Haematococcus lacustris]